MADLLKDSGALSSRRPVLAETPQTALLQEERLRPYTQLARAVGGLGDAIQEAAVPFEREAMAAAPRAIIADPTTEANIQAGRKPSWPIMMQRPDGAWEQMRDMNNRPIRFQPDADAWMRTGDPAFRARVEQRRQINAGRMPTREEAATMSDEDAAAMTRQRMEGLALSPAPPHRAGRLARMAEGILTMDDLIRALRDRRRALGLSQIAVDDLAGLPDGYTSKIEMALSNPGAKNTRAIGWDSLPLILGALGVSLALVQTDPNAKDDKHLTSRARRKLSDGKARAARLKWHLMSADQRKRHIAMMNRARRESRKAERERTASATHR